MNEIGLVSIEELRQTKLLVQTEKKTEDFTQLRGYDQLIVI